VLEFSSLKLNEGIAFSFLNTEDSENLPNGQKIFWSERGIAPGFVAKTIGKKFSIVIIENIWQEMSTDEQKCLLNYLISLANNFQNKQLEVDRTGEFIARKHPEIIKSAQREIRKLNFSITKLEKGLANKHKKLYQIGQVECGKLSFQHANMPEHGVNMEQMQVDQAKMVKKALDNDKVKSKIKSLKEKLTQAKSFLLGLEPNDIILKQSNDSIQNYYDEIYNNKKLVFYTNLSNGLNIFKKFLPVDLD
ncbi:hypothetical protein MHK_005283, partial [Candidatus Magnetomorum sp. HK-1]